MCRGWQAALDGRTMEVAKSEMGNAIKLEQAKKRSRPVVDGRIKQTAPRSVR